MAEPVVASNDPLADALPPDLRKVWEGLTQEERDRKAAQITAAIEGLQKTDEEPPQ